MKKPFYILFFLILNLKVCTLNCYAQPGSLDPTFGVGGIVITSIGIGNEAATSAAFQTDGKIVVAGYSCVSSFGDHDFALVRYNIDGSLDTTFDNDGKVTIDLGSLEDDGNSVAIQADGKIIISGTSNTNFALVRFNVNGSLDSSFDFDGRVITDINLPFNDYCYSITLQSDGKILAAGHSVDFDYWNFALLRYNINGSLDSNFGINGVVITDIGGLEDFGYSLSLQLDGKILVAGTSFNGVEYDFALVRYNSNGSLDSTFDLDGIVTTSIGELDFSGVSLSIQTDGKIIVSGTSDSSQAFSLIRYNLDGSLDTTFDLDGKVSTDYSIYGESAYSLSIQTDGKILVTGYSKNSIGLDVILARYKINGSLDSSFGTDGKAIIDVGVWDEWGKFILIQGDGKIVVVGQTVNSFYDFMVLRFSISPLAFNQNNTSKETSIFPNPASSNLNFYCEKSLTNASLKITNSTGQLIFTQQNLNGNYFTFNVSTFANGIYFLEMNDGEIVSRTKFIKE